jgi:hypothetical protein
MKMLLTMGDRALPIAMLEVLVVHLKICGSQTNIRQLHDGFDLFA